MTPEQAQQQLSAHRDAWGKVLAWAEAARAFEALALALRSGLLDPDTGAVAAHAAGLSDAASRELLATLAAAGVLRPIERGWELTEEFTVLANRSAPQRLEALLGRELALLDAIRGGAADHRAEQLALGSGMDPHGPLAVISSRGMVGVFPQVAARWEQPARHLELGCGVASMALALLQAFPLLTVDGVEIDPDTAARASDRAVRLGVEQRFRVHVQDAQTFRASASFDSVQWSQQFFPAPARARTCGVAFEALKPGGFLVAPTFGPDLEPAQAASAQLGLASMRLAFARNGAEVRSEAEVIAELRVAGFEHVSTVALPPSPYMFARSTVLVRKPG